jgi:long-subunit fatty acid transport protein
MKKMIVSALLLFTSSIYTAGTYDIISVWDNKTNAFLGGGVASVNGVGGLFINPAGLSNINKLDVTVASTIMITDSYGPMNGVNTIVRNNTAYPIGSIGAVYRFNDLITAGFGFYTPSAGGVTYNGVNYNIPGLEAREFSAKVYFAEFTPTISFNVLKNLNIGLTYRIHYTRQNAAMYDVSNLTNITYNTTKLSGTGFSGIRLGVQYKPCERLHLGLAYSNYVGVKTTGTVTATAVATDTATTYNIESESEYADKILFGTTYEAILKKLFIGFDIQYNLYSNYTSLDTTYTDLNTTVSIPQMMKNNFTLRLFGEYFVNERLPLRAAFSHSTKSARDEYHGALSTASPAGSYVFALGCGYELTQSWILDFSTSFAFNSGSVTTEEATTPYAVVGDYKSNSYYISFGASYKL